ncbi:MAG TPA: AsmA family protein [Casimicrobiaceae bacterium]
MRRTALIILAVAGGLTVLILAAVAIAVATVDLHAVIGPVQARVKAATGRDLAINGPIDLKLSLEPKVVFSDVTFSNVAGSKIADMVRAKRIEAQVRLLPLLSRRFEVVEVTLTDPVIVLETDAQGHANWDFGPRSGAAAATPASATSTAAAGAFGVGNFAIDNGTVMYVDGASGKTTRVVIDHLAIQARNGDAPVRAEFRGKVGDIALSLTGNLGPLDALRAGKWPYPVEANGTVDDKPFSITTKLAVQGDTIQLDDLDLTFASFKAQGHVAVASANGRKRYTFELIAPAVALADVPVPIVTAPAATAPRPASKFIFSDEPLPIDALKAFDADGHLTMAGLTLKNGAKVSNVDVSLSLRDGKLEVSKWQAGALGGTLAGSFALDATHAQAPTMATRMTGRNLDLAVILAAVGTPRQTRGGATTLDVHITAHGLSPHAWASSATGTFFARVGPTTLVNTKLNLDHALDQLAQALNPFREGDASTELECAVVRLPLKDGIAHVDRSLAIDSKKVSVSASGTLDFRSETLDLALHPLIKQGIPIDIPQVAQLVRFKGPFEHPGVSIDAAGSAAVVAKIGAAISTGGLSMLGTSLIERAAANEDVCAIAAGRAAPAASNKTPAQSASPPPNARNEIGKALGKLFGGAR